MGKEADINCHYAALASSRGSARDVAEFASTHTCSISAKSAKPELRPYMAFFMVFL